MKKNLPILLFLILISSTLRAQVEPTAGNWKTWFIPSGKSYRLPAPSSHKEEVAQVIAQQKALTAQGMQQIAYWSAGSPGYHWHEMIGKLWMNDISNNGALANMLLGTAIHDATVAAWDTKYAHNRPRPFAADKRIVLHGTKPESPSYPCEHSVAAGVAVAIFTQFYPNLADSVNRMAQRAMESRIASGVAFPSDTRAGFELGKKIAMQEIEHTKDFVYKKPWDGKRPTTKGIWNGKMPLFPVAGLCKTAVLDSASQFRPGPPPDFAKDMAELKNFKRTFRSSSNAYYYATQSGGDNMLTKKMFEYNVFSNPPRAARIYAAVAVAYYDAFIACFDAKYAYWGIRPDQYDTTYQALIPTPPFPGYPSGHAVMSGVIGELFPYFFPAEKAVFQKIAKDGAESRFHAGIHFRTDNDSGLDLGKKVAEKVVDKLKADGADPTLRTASNQNK